MAIFNSYVKLPEGTYIFTIPCRFMALGESQPHQPHPQGTVGARVPVQAWVLSENLGSFQHEAPPKSNVS